MSVKTAVKFFTHSSFNIAILQEIYALDLDSLTYHDDVIDLSMAECVPIEFGYLPIGGTLGVACQHGKHIYVDSSSKTILSDNPIDYREFISADSSHIIGINGGDITVFRISNTGQYEVIMVS